MADIKLLPAFTNSLCFKVTKEIMWETMKDITKRKKNEKKLYTNILQFVMK